MILLIQSCSLVGGGVLLSGIGFGFLEFVLSTALTTSAGGAYTCNVPYDLIETLFQHPFNIVPSERLISCHQWSLTIIHCIGPLLLVSSLLAAQFLALEQLIDFARISQLIVDSLLSTSKLPNRTCLQSYQTKSLCSDL